MNALAKSVATVASAGLLVLGGTTLPENNAATAGHTDTRMAEDFGDEPADITPASDSALRPLPEGARPVAEIDGPPPPSVKGEVVLLGFTLLLTLGGLIFAASRWADLR